MRKLTVCMGAVLLFHCSNGSPDSQADAASKPDVASDPDASEADVASDPDVTAPDACASLPLQVLTAAVPEGGVYPEKLYVEVVPDMGSPGLFLVDTGSAQTFLREELGTPSKANAGTVRIGCDSLSLPGFAEAPLGPPFQGLPLIGTFGLDRFLSGPSLIDVEHATFVQGALGDSAAWPSAPFDLVQSTLLVHVKLEGGDVRLLVDTGSDHTLWLGQPAQPGDTPSTTVDSGGNTLTFYLGSGHLTIGVWTETVPIVRVPSFPYLESYIQKLGGNIDGLLGLSSFARALALDPNGRTIRVRP